MHSVNWRRQGSASHARRPTTAGRVTPPSPCPVPRERGRLQAVPHTRTHASCRPSPPVARVNPRGRQERKRTAAARPPTGESVDRPPIDRGLPLRQLASAPRHPAPAGDPQSAPPLLGGHLGPPPTGRAAGPSRRGRRRPHGLPGGERASPRTRHRWHPVDRRPPPGSPSRGWVGCPRLHIYPPTTAGPKSCAHPLGRPGGT